MKISLNQRALVLWTLLGVSLLLVLAYMPALEGEFLWDDDDNIVTRDVIHAPDGIIRIWSDIHSTQQYYPLTHTSFWLQYQLFGQQTWPYHLLNLLLHGGGAFLVYRLLNQLGIAGAHFAAILFALHPLQVESVAWITERKNVLSLPLYVLSAGFFLRSRGIHLPENPSRSAKRDYCWALVLFVLAMLAKTALSVLPAVLLVVLFWKKGERAWRDSVWLAPLFLLGVLGGALTAWIEVTTVSARGLSFDFGPLERTLRASKIAWFYLRQIVFPVGQSFIYPRWEIRATDPWLWTYFATGVGVLVALLVRTRRGCGAGPFVATLSYLICIFPALGFFNVAFMRWSFVQDHFAYAASVPFFALLGVGFARATQSIEKPAQMALFATISLALTSASAMHASRFATYNGLFEHALEQAPDSWLANHNLAVRYHQAGRKQLAVEHYRRALATAPFLPAANNNLGALLFEGGEFEQALDHMKKAADAPPLGSSFQQNYAIALFEAGKDREAAVQLRIALRHRKDWIKGQRLLAQLLATSSVDAVRDGNEAVRLAQHACAQTKDTLPRCLATLAAAQAETGAFIDAAQTARRASSLAASAGNDSDAKRFASLADQFAREKPLRRAKPEESKTIP